MGRLPSLRTLAWHLLFALACFGAAWLGLQWADRSTATLPFWPAAGIAIYGVRRLGLPSIWAVAAGLLAALLDWRVELAPGLLIAAGNGAAAAVAAIWIRRRLPRAGGGSPASLGELLAVMAGASSIAAVAGMIAAAGWRDGATLPVIARVGVGGFLGHFAGVVVVTPFLINWLAASRAGRLAMPVAAKLHLALLLAATASLCWPVFLSGGSSPLRTWHLYPLLIWSALAFRARGATAALLIVSVAAIYGVINGLGPFGPVSDSTWSAVLLAQQFVVVTGLIILLLAEVADQRRALGPLRAARSRFDFALDAAGMVGWEYSADGSRIRSFGDVGRFYGRPVATGADLAAALHPEDREATLLSASRALRSGERDYELEYRVLLPDGEIRHVLARGRAVSRDGETPTLSGIAIDVTARRRDEERQVLLMAELDHRVKNILATIQALISRTATDKTSVPELAATLKGRVQAMARAHSMLARNRWEGASLRGLLEDELMPYGHDRVALLGPDVQLTPRAALSLSLVLHELATNAAKYGALSSVAGQVAIGWAIEANGPTLVLDWNERGGPPLAGKPTRKGFGTVMTDRVITHEFGGRIETDYAPAGLSFRIQLPFGRVGQGGLATSAPSPAAAPTPPPAANLAGRRVLLVEDSPIIADATSAQLVAAGVAVIGPFGSVAAALAAVETGRPDAALLDVSLGDEMVFPLAERLGVLRVPFAFATGYGNDAVIPRAFRDRPRLLKPFDEPSLLSTLGGLLSA